MSWGAERVRELVRFEKNTGYLPGSVQVNENDHRLFLGDTIAMR